MFICKLLLFDWFFPQFCKPDVDVRISRSVSEGPLSIMRNLVNFDLKFYTFRKLRPAVKSNISSLFAVIIILF